MKLQQSGDNRESNNGQHSAVPSAPALDEAPLVRVAVDGSSAGQTSTTHRDAEPATEVHVMELTPDLEQAWSRYVQSSKSATVFHELGWMRAVQHAYHHRPRYLLALRDGREVCGILPLFEVWGPFTGRAIVSVPYAVYGGVAAESPAVTTALLTHARTLADQIDVGYLEVRQGVPLQGFVDRCHHFTFRKSVPESLDQVISSFPRKARTAIRAARDRHHLRFEIGNEHVDVLHRLYVTALRRLGSPPHTKRFFHELMEQLGDGCKVATVWLQDRPVAGSLTLIFKNQLIPYFYGGDPRYTELNISNFLYFSLIEYAVTSGLQVFDFGRTRQDNTGGCQFKMNQGFEPEPLHYSFYSPREIEAPDLRPTNAKFSLARKLWRCLPLGAVRVLGGVASRWLP